VTRCVEFDEPTISGYELLLRSGLSLVINSSAGQGAVVCAIGDSGCPVDDCWCECKNLAGTCVYWSYWHLQGGAWVYSSMGLTGYQVRPGDVEGWHWGTTEAPPMVAFEQICAPPPSDTPTATATWTPSPTAPPTATWTSTPQPTLTTAPAPTETSTPLPPTATPAATATRLAAAAITPAPSATKAGLRLPAATATIAPSATLPPSETPNVLAGLPSPTAGEAQPAATTPTLVAQPTLQPSATAVPSATATGAPTRIAAVTRSSGAPEATAARVDPQGSEGAGRRGLLTALSLGLGAAYAFFVLFVIALAGLFVFVRLRQR
jgi:hypothetical protein